MIGPELPPHLRASRKNEDSGDTEEASIGPKSAKKGAIAPEIPAHLLPKRKREGNEAEEEAPRYTGPASPDGGMKRPRTAGPAMPPHLLASQNKPGEEEEKAAPRVAEEDNDSSSEDEWGPAPPKASGGQGYDISESTRGLSSMSDQSAAAPVIKRDAWMMMPPKQDDLAARMDPSKLRARKFNSGMGARGDKDGENSLWTETPEQKRKRLENQVLGKDPTGKTSKEDRKRAREQEVAKRIREQTDKARGPSLYEKHTASLKGDEEDDPTKRAFDKTKDIGGRKMTEMDRRKMLERTSDYKSRFSSGSFL